MRNSSLLWAFIKKDFINDTTYKLHFVLQFLGIFFSVLSFFFLSRIIPGSSVVEYGGDYFSFVLIGVAMTSFLGLGMGGFAATIRDMQVTGTIEFLVSSPATFPVILIGSLLYSYLFTIIRLSVYFVFGMFFFGMILNVNFFPAILILILSIICFSLIGTISASMIILFKKGDPFTWAVGTLFGLLAGTMYPITILPSWLQKISALLPLTYSLRAMRHAVIQGYPFAALLPDILVLLGFCLLLMPISISVFRYALKKAKKDGSLVKF